MAGRTSLQEAASQYFQAKGTLARADSNLKHVAYIVGKKNYRTFCSDVIAHLNEELDRKYQDFKLTHPKKERSK